VKCPKCGAENTPETVYCVSCGTQIGVPDSYRPPKKTNYTLVGVLAGCGCLLLIIPILAAILFPVFAKAREKARVSTCMSDLNSIGKAIRCYMTDYDDTLPSSALYGHTRTWDKSAFMKFASELGDNPPRANDPHKSWPELLDRYHPGISSLAVCPADPGHRRQTYAPTDRASYYWKAAADYACYQNYGAESWFAYPTQQAIIYEHNGWHYGDSSRGLTDGVTINCVYMDGHVHRASIKESGYTIDENPPDPLPAGGTGEPAWYNCEAATGVTAVSNYWKPDKYRDSLP
jgi:type II secretory pathway pseudopilin PulG